MKRNFKASFTEQKIPVIAAVIITAILLFPSILYASDNENSIKKSDRGLIDLSSRDFDTEGPVRLDGLWEFRWNRLLDPGDPGWDDNTGIQGFYPVPLFWTGYKGLNLPSAGCCTYRLHVKTSGLLKNYGLITPEIFTEYRLWINGELIDQRGSFNGGRIKFMKPDVFTFHTNSDDIGIILQVKNASHGNAGIGQSLILGKENQVYRLHIRNMLMEIILIAICLFAGLYHTIIFIFRREEKELLYFGLFCIIISLRTFSTGSTLITQIFPELSFGAGSRIATAVIPLSVITFQTFAFYFYKNIMQKKIFLILTSAQFIYLLAVFTTSTSFYSTIYTYYLAAIVASAFFIIGVNIYAIIKKVQYSIIFLSGFMFVFIGAANDMLHYMQVINTGYYLALFFSAFIITESLMLAIKFSREHRMVEELSEKLKVLDKLKDEFLANTSHELRTPLNGIIGIAESLIDGVTGTLPAKTVQNLRLIVSSGRRLYSLINDILDFSKLKNNDIVLQKKDIDLRQLVSIVMTVIKASMPGKDVELINEIPEDTPFVEGDENRLQQIMYNLIGNAVKFTSHGYIKVSSSVKGDFIEIKVEDTGIGIASGRLEAIFQSFEQSDGSISREYSGTGLGLPITKNLVELHGGTINVESEPGKGSCFSFTLRGVRSRESSGRDNTLIIKSPECLKVQDCEPVIIQGTRDSRFDKKILVVDDEPVNIQVLLNHLAIKQYKADYASNGVDAIKMLETGDYDLVLLDIMMPRMSGYEVCRKLRKKYTSYELPIIFLTAKNQSADIVAAFDAGANDYLIKPLGKTELFARIDTQLSLKRAVSEALTNAELANTDHLTGLYNRRFLANAGKREFENAKRFSRELSVILLDIDNFKLINDTYGHDTGDIAIKQLSSIIMKNIRVVDIPIRYGGDEFILILPGTPVGGALFVAEKIRTIVEESIIMMDKRGKLNFTVSLGLSSYRNSTNSFDDILKEVDDMMYISKYKGRNRVTPYKPE